MSARSPSSAATLEPTLIQPPQNLETRQILARVGADLFGETDAATGRYEIVGKLGAGGMGVVYEAHDPLLDCNVALKQLHTHLVDEPGFLERLRAEARAMAKLRSEPHVVTLYDFFVQRDVVFVVMELVRGTTLRTWQHEPHRVDGVLAIYEQAGRGLAAAHRAGLVHRDFKPENVLLDHRGVAKVSDFGLVRDANARAVTSQLLAHEATDPGTTGSSGQQTRPGSVVGTPRYMAPEQLCAEPAEPRSDQFSFCLALWEALFDEHPFFPVALNGSERDATQPSAAQPSPAPALTSVPLPLAYAHAILSGPLHPVPTGSVVPAHVIAALVRGLSRTPASRFASVEDLLAALRPPLARRRLAPLLGLATVVGAAFWAMMPSSEDPPPTRAELKQSALADITGELAPTALPAALPAHVGQELSRYALRWAEQNADQNVKLQQWPGDPETMTRLRCLAEARRGARTVAEGLRAADASNARSVELVDELPAPEECVTMAMDWLACSQSLTAIASTPAAAPAFAAMDAASRLEAAGQFDAAVARAATAVADANSFGHPLLRGQAGYLHGRLLYLSGRSEEAVAALTTARDAVEPTGCLELRGNIYSRLIKTTAMYPGVPATHADEWSRLHMVLARATPDGGARLADSYNERGLLRLLRRGDPRGALADLQQAIDLRERILDGRLSSELADSYLNLGIARRQLGDLDGAELAIQEALRERHILYGADHPLQYRELKERAEIQLDRGELEAAESTLREALARAETGIGRNTIPAARVLLTLAHLRLLMGDDADARQIADDAALRVAGADIDPSERMEVRLNALVMGDGPELTQALRTLADAADDDPHVTHETRALIALKRAEHAYNTDDNAMARDHAERAFTLLARAGLGPESELVAQVRRVRGLTALALDELDVAISMLGSLDDLTMSGTDRSAIELALVEAYLTRDGHGDHERGCTRLRALVSGPQPPSREQIGLDLANRCSLE